MRVEDKIAQKEAKFRARYEAVLERSEARKLTRKPFDVAAYRRQWYLAHRESLGYSKTYKTTRDPEERKGLVRMYRANRHAAQLQATPPWLNKTQRQQIRTLYIEAASSGSQMEVDHIIPLRNPAVCGLHVPWNLRIITRAENRTKRNKLLIDMAKPSGYPKQADT